METVEFFSKMATKLGYGRIAERAGATRPTVAKLLNYKAATPVRRQPTGVLVLEAVEVLARERADSLRQEATEIEQHLPGLQKWKEDLMQT